MAKQSTLSRVRAGLDTNLTQEEFGDFKQEALSELPNKPEWIGFGMASMYCNPLNDTPPIMLDLRFHPRGIVKFSDETSGVFVAVHEAQQFAQENPYALPGSIYGSDAVRTLNQVLIEPFRNDGKSHPRLDMVRQMLGWKMDHQLVDYLPGPAGSYYQEPVMIALGNEKQGPTSTAEAWLRLTMLSKLMRRPQSMVMDGTFGQMERTAFTNCGPVRLEDLEELRWNIDMMKRIPQPVAFNGDKFPPMTLYVSLADRVRAADVTRLRLGAHLASGTTVMHGGFCNFNAGTVNTNDDPDAAFMIEGRISAGVIVGTGSDLGGGASIAGTLSGGGEEVISIGERCLVGANAGVGISLGNDCKVEAGLYVTAQTPVTAMEELAIGYPEGAIGKASLFSGMDNLLFLRNGLTGQVEVRLNRKSVKLNTQLHA